MDSKFRQPGLDSPHRKYWEHIEKGGYVFRNDPLNKVREWINVEALGGDANAISRYGFTDLVLPPPDASDYVDDGFSLTFYRRATAFGMKVLDYWTGEDWKTAGTLPWSSLQSVPGVAVQTLAQPKGVSIGANTAEAFHVGDEAYTVEVALSDGHLAYYGQNGRYPYLTKKQAHELAESVNRSGEINPSLWINSDGYPLGFSDATRRELEEVRSLEDENAGIGEP